MYIRSRRSGLGLLSMLWSATLVNAYTWPNPDIDFLESLYYQHNGHNSIDFGVLAASCGTGTDFPLPGIIASAEWLRTAYHDMATANVTAGTGGMDASISFELDRPENKGNAFLNTIDKLTFAMSASSSLADLIALATIMVITACSPTPTRAPIVIPFRAGRIDATGPGPTGVPRPEERLQEHVEKFAYQGFNTTDMIGLVACGHSIGGVHGKDFPEIVPVLNTSANVESVQPFDNTRAVLDNHIATSFLANSTQNALAFGPNEITRSDFRIFMSDGGQIISKMASSADFFYDTCGPLFERMINTVPKTVDLSEPVQPIAVKPDNIYMSVDSISGNMTIQGEIRIDNKLSRNGEVVIHLKPATDSHAAITSVSATRIGDNQPLQYNQPTFIWYNFTATVPAKIGFSSFTVDISKSGNSTIYDNGGGGFPLDPEILPLPSLSCGVSNGSEYKLNVTAAVLDSASFSAVKLSLPVPTRQVGSKVPRFNIVTVDMEKTKSINGTGYSLYRGLLKVPGEKFNVVLTYNINGSGGEDEDVEVLHKPWSGLKYQAC